jgi:hypothetical protein
LPQAEDVGGLRPCWETAEQNRYGEEEHMPGVTDSE